MHDICLLKSMHTKGKDKFMKKHVLIIGLLGVMLTSLMTACGNKASKEANTTIQSRPETETSTQKSNQKSLDEEDLLEGNNMENDTQNSSSSDWEEAYKDVLLNPQKYEVSLMDSTTPDNGWENLGFTIIDLDGDNTPELLVYYNDGSEASAADVLAYTNGTIQNIASVWAEGAFKAEKGSFVTIDNGGLYGSSFHHRYEKNKQGIYEQIKSFDYIDDEGSEMQIYKEDDKEISKDQFIADRTANDMDYSDQCIEASGMYHVLDDGLSKATSKETMDEFWTK